MTGIHIRRAVPGDEAAIHEAHMRSIREVCVKDHGEEEIKGWGFRQLGNRWIRPIKEDFVWVAELNSTVQGFAYIRMFEQNGERLAHLHGLYLTPELIGRGVGYKLATLMLSAAREQKATGITLESSLTAHEFYKRLGFADTGALIKVEINGHPVSCYPMAMKLLDGQPNEI
jgi:putative acetyltransferase